MTTPELKTATLDRKTAGPSRQRRDGKRKPTDQNANGDIGMKNRQRNFSTPTSD